MAEIARDYHNDLQSDETELDPQAKNRAIEEALDGITSKADHPEMAMLAEELEERDVITALKQSALGSASGVNGIPTEFWLKLHIAHLESKKSNNTATTPQFKTFDVIKVLTAVYNDIERHGVVKGTEFATGWMCPIWKKKDPTDIANYRPITLLNTDYKIFTKALTNKLSRIAPYLIHKDQAGFMKGRKISDQIFLAMEVVDYSEDDVQNGAIVALDQEKAYDETSHRYLWKAMEKQGIPAKFINIVKALYADAHTHVVINGEFSSTFKIIRGVRQGDPLLCLLFNLAIEPLAKMLRKSNLRGYSIPHVMEKVVVKMFADDTTVYLDAEDSFDGLQLILKK
jgi:hypothetical protein